jgi:hypothetical protein
MDLYGYLLRHLYSTEETGVNFEDPRIIYAALSEY